MIECSKAIHWISINIWIAALAWLLAGCLYIPTPGRKAFEGREVKADDLAFLQPAETGKEEVIRRLGQPTVFWRDENILIYRWVKLRGVLLWVAPAQYTGVAGLLDVTQEFAFLIKFDRDDRFLSSETLEKPLMKPYGQFLLEWRDAQRARGWRPHTGEP